MKNSLHLLPQQLYLQLELQVRWQLTQFLKKDLCHKHYFLLPDSNMKFLHLSQKHSPM